MHTQTPRPCHLTLPLATFLLFAATAQADPCGMVPPLWSMSVANAIERVGLQQTYVFFKDGVETFVIRPAFTGKVDQFGMLVPFPSPPSIRKVPDAIFSHIANAVDPPEVPLWLSRRGRNAQFRAAPMPTSVSRAALASLGYSDVRVLRQEAVGMYEVAVLEAGSARALKRWMTDHEYRFPDGMEDVANDYVAAGWCFVAVKARVGQKRGVEPRPGMRAVDSKLPPGATFDGAVQAMGFRFQVAELVVPMRLGAFNPGELRNVVYLLSDEPMKVRQLPKDFVKRQVSGADLRRNVAELLPVRVHGGPVSDVTEEQLQQLRPQRDPAPHNRLARELFTGDLRAALSGELSHPHEEEEKVLLAIGEELGLRGPAIDALHRQALAESKAAADDDMLAELERLTLTVIDGDFPRALLQRENLWFETYRMPEFENRLAYYDAKRNGRGAQLGGEVFWGTPKHLTAEPWWRFWE